MPRFLIVSDWESSAAVAACFADDAVVPLLRQAKQTAVGHWLPLLERRSKQTTCTFTNALLLAASGGTGDDGWLGSSSLGRPDEET